MCFPTVANAVVGSVPIDDVGVAAGTNNAIREIGGAFGVAIISAVFIAQGNYSSRSNFIDGFKPAEMVAAILALVGLLATVLAPSKKQADQPYLGDPEPSYAADAVIDAG